jgi:small subunit ribosomal protein S1
VVDTYGLGDELQGRVTKVVSFGAFVEIMDGVEGLVHISELAQHHVENPREVVSQGDEVKVKVLEIDSERRRLSLSVKRVEGQSLPLRTAEPPPAEQEVTDGDLTDVPELELSEDVFAGAEGTDAQETGAEETDVTETGAEETNATEASDAAPEEAAAAEDRPAG